MLQMGSYYWFGLAAMIYLVTCWVFSLVRWFHTCQTPKEHSAYIWPDRKLQVYIYLFGNLLIPYVVNPASEAAWLLQKSYFPCTYYFYCGVLLFCFFGSVKQWSQWKTVSWIAGLITTVGIAPLVIHAWLPGGLLNENGAQLWMKVVVVISFVMMVYCALSMWQVWQWMKQARDANYSNPDDFPFDYAKRVWLAPLLFTPLLWPAFIYDSHEIMAVMNVLLAASNMLLLLTVMPAWRRTAILSSVVEDQQETEATDELAAERTDRIAAEIERFVKTQQAFLNPHLKLEHVVDHCSYSRSYVSKVFQDRFNGFSDYVNGLRLEYYCDYVKRYPHVTKDAAAQASGFTSYRAYHRARERFLKRERGNG